MAIFRKIHTQFWGDTFVQTLTPEKKYFYLYLLTNEKTKQCGIYEISARQISYDTGYNVETVNSLLDYFIDANKILVSRETNEIAIKNWTRYNDSRSPGVQKCVNEELTLVKNRKLVMWVQSGGTVGGLPTQEEPEEEPEEEKNQSGFLAPIPIIGKMLNLWLELNKNYKPSDIDRRAIRKLAVFISGRKGIEHLDEKQTGDLLETWENWCFFILQSIKYKNFSLEKIERFYSNEIHQELLNPSSNGTGAKNKFVAGRDKPNDKL